MTHKQKAEIVIYLILLVSLSIIIFPIIGINQLSSFELGILEYSKSFISNEKIITTMTENINMLSYKTYAYAVYLLNEYLNLDATLAVRIPSALLIIAITSTLYIFNAIYETLNKSLLASALFVCCAAVMLLTFTASPVLIPAYTLILTLIALYNQIRTKSIIHLLLLTGAITLVTLTIGCYAVAVIAIIAYLFLLITGEKSVRSYLNITLAILIATVIAFVIIILINRDPFAVREIITLNNYSQYSNLKYFIIALLFTSFPWSVPLVISLFWVFRNPKWGVVEFNALKPLQQYGITILLCTIPTMFNLNGLSIIMIIATIFFNMVVMSSLFMLQLRHYALAFRLTGVVTAIIAITVAITYIVIPNTDYDFWGLVIIALITLFTYTLSRNKRSLDKNNRYMYNIILLYLLTAILFIGYILPYIL